MKIKQPFWLLYKVYVLVVFFGTLVPFYPIFYYLLAKESRWERCFVWQVRWGKTVRFFTGIRLKISGLDLLPSSPYVIISNHASYIDTILMYGIIPHFFVFMGMAELTRYPMFGRFFTSGQNIPVNRISRGESVKAFKLAGQKLENGIPVALFPEGGIKPVVPDLAPFKNGAFRLAFDHNVPIVPIMMFNTHNILESNNVFYTSGYPGVAIAKVLEPIQTSHLKQEDLIPLREQIRTTMQQELDDFYQKTK